jgi:rhodanese-related sulfurtransferase
VVVVDVRTGRDWKSSEFKIKGAVRYENDIVKWASTYDKDTTLVLYCA